MADALKDSFKQFANKKQEILSRLADTHEERIINTLKNLEDEIIADLTRLTAGGVKLNTQLAIQLRPNLKTLIEQNFLKEADGIISEYDEIVKEYQRFIRPLPIPDRFKTLTKPDLRVINQLKILSFSGFEDVGNRFLDTIANEVYQSSVTGRPFNEMVKNIRGQISGVYQRSNENAVNRLVDYIDKNRYSENAQIIERVKKAREVLHTKYASDILGNNMRRYASQIAQDSLMQFDGQFTLYKGKEAGITKFQYVGTNITTTRSFCRRYLDRVFTEEEARSIWQQSWRGKSGTDPFINRGGYRCRHSFILYDDDWFTEETDDNIQEQTKTNERQRKEQAEKKTQSLVPNVAIGSLLNKGSDKIRKNYEDEFNSQLTDQQKNIANRIEKPTSISKGSGVYRYRTGELVASSNAKSKVQGGEGVKSFVIAHEYGHHIDYVTSGEKLKFWSALNEDFAKAIDKDRRKFKGQNFKDLRGISSDGYYIIDNEELDKIFNELATREKKIVTITRRKRKYEVLRNITELNGDGYASISDIIDALTRGNFSKKYGMWGHGTSYFNKQGYIQMEIFANLFAIKHNEKAYNLAKKYIPNTVKEFEKRLKELERF